MPRYFLEVAYKGTSFKGFQSQLNGPTIQGEINNVLQTLLRVPILTTTSSRTDAGVHAQQNFLHADIDAALTRKFIYNANSILHDDVFIRNIYEVNDNAHARFDALSRSYQYRIVHNKNPFEKEFAYFFPFQIHLDLLQASSQILLETKDFTSFAKRHSDVNNHICTLSKASWHYNGNVLIFEVTGNRFLRGMVRALVATSLQVARGNISLHDLQVIIEAKDCSKADFSAEAKGLFLQAVEYPNDLFKNNV
jgi:tRNA pseudouridine38-40 synthase